MPATVERTRTPPSPAWEGSPKRRRSLREEVPPPCRVVLVPLDRFEQPLVEVARRRPAEGPQLGAVERVAAVVADPVGHVLDAVAAVAELFEDEPDHVEVAEALPGADGVPLPGLPVLEHPEHG